jgi:hypothetical protein
VDEDLQALESAVLDGLDAAEDADAPPGTVPLSAAHRRRALDETARLLGTDGEGPDSR